jgi:hypothetical protein
MAQFEGEGPSLPLIAEEYAGAMAGPGLDR